MHNEIRWGPDTGSLAAGSLKATGGKTWKTATYSNGKRCGRAHMAVVGVIKAAVKAANGKMKEKEEGKAKGRD